MRNNPTPTATAYPAAPIALPYSTLISSAPVKAITACPDGNELLLLPSGRPSFTMCLRAPATEIAQIYAVVPAISLSEKLLRPFIPNKPRLR